MKAFIISLLISLIIVSSISCSTAWLLTPILPFHVTAISLTFILFAIVFLVNSYKQKQIELKELAIAEQMQEEDERNTVLITCPCNQNTFPMQVYVNEINEYTCDVCKNSFYINVVTEPVLQTTPINLDNSYKIFTQLKDGKEEHN